MREKNKKNREEQKRVRSKAGESFIPCSASVNNHPSHLREEVFSSCLKEDDIEDINDSSHHSFSQTSLSSVDLSEKKEGIPALSSPSLTSSDEYQVTKISKGFCRDGQTLSPSYNVSSSFLASTTSSSPSSSHLFLKEKSLQDRKKENKRTPDKNSQREEEEGVKNRDECRHRKQSSSLVDAPSTSSSTSDPLSSSLPSPASFCQEVKETESRQENHKKEEEEAESCSLNFSPSYTSLSSLLVLINNYQVPEEDGQKQRAKDLREEQVKKKESSLNEPEERNSSSDACDRQSPSRTFSCREDSCCVSQSVSCPSSSLPDLEKQSGVNRSKGLTRDKEEKSRDHLCLFIPPETIKDSQCSSSSTLIIADNTSSFDVTSKPSTPYCFSPQRSCSSEVTIDVGSSSLPRNTRTLPAISSSPISLLPSPSPPSPLVYPSSSATFYLDSRSGLTFDDEGEGIKESFVVLPSSSSVNPPSSVTSSCSFNSFSFSDDKMNGNRREREDGGCSSSHGTVIDSSSLSCQAVSSNVSHPSAASSYVSNDINSFHDYFYGQDIPGTSSLAVPVSRLRSSCSSSSFNPNTSTKLHEDSKIEAAPIRSDKRLKYNTVIDRLRKFARPQSSSSRGKSSSSSTERKEKKPKETFQSHVKRCSSLRGISNSLSEMDISHSLTQTPNRIPNNNKKGTSSSQFSLEGCIDSVAGDISYPSILSTKETAFVCSSSSTASTTQGASSLQGRKDSMRRSFLLPVTSSSSSSHVTVVSTSNGDHHNYNHCHVHQNHVHPPPPGIISFHSIRLRRYASDESLPSDSGCGSSIKTDSNRSSICTVEDPSHSSSSTSSQTGSHSITLFRGPFIGRARAKIHCTPCPYDKDALAFKRGDIVNIIAKNDTGTWIGSCNGKIGHFKFINVEEIPECRPGYHPFGCCSSTSICHPSMSHVSSSSSVVPDCTSSSSSMTSVMVTPDTTSSRCNNKCNSNCLLPLTVTSSTGNCSSCHASGVESETATKVYHNHHPRINLKKSTTSEMSGASHVVVVSSQQAKYQDTRYNSQQRSQLEGESILSNSNKNTRVIRRSRRKVSQEEREQFSRMKDFLMTKNASSSCSGGHFTKECNTATCIEQTSSLESSPLDLSLTVGQFFDLLSLGLSGNEYAALVSSKGFPDLKSLMFQVSVQEVEDLLSSCISNTTHLDFILNALDFLRDLSSTPKTDNEGRDRELKSGPSLDVKRRESVCRERNEVEAAGGEQEDTLSSEKNRSEIEKNNKKNNPNSNSSGKKTTNESDFTPGHNFHARVSCYVHSSSPSCCSCSVGLPPSSLSFNSSSLPFNSSSCLPAKIEQRRGSASSDNNSRNPSSLIPTLRSNKKNEEKHHPSPALTAKSAPSTPALELTTDDLTNWFRNKLHFFSGKEHSMVSGDASLNREESDGGAGKNSSQVTSTPKHCSSKTSSSKTSSSTSRLVNSQSSHSGFPSTSSLRYSQLKAKSKSFFLKKERATSVGPVSRISINNNNRHSSYEPFYANSTSIERDGGEGGYSDHHTVLYTHHHNDPHLAGVIDQHQDYDLSRSSSKFIDSEYLVENIAHTYRPRNSSLSTSVSLQNFSRSVFDLRNESSSSHTQSNVVHQSNLNHQMEVKNRLYKNMRNKDFSSVFATPSSATKTRSKSTCIASDVEGGTYLVVNLDAGVPSSSSLTHLSSKPMSSHLLDALSFRLKEESIDLTCNPYSDVGGFCGIPPALVQRYSEEFPPYDVYEVADALDHLRLEALLLKGRRGIPNDFLGDACSGPVVETANCENLNRWLTSIGLPQYESSLRLHGWSDLESVSRIKEVDLTTAGIINRRHQRILISALGSLNLSIKTTST